MDMKNVIKSIMPPVLYDFCKLIKNKKKFFGLDELDKILIEYIDYEGGFFVELGANDGISQSNTYHLEAFKKWNGVLIEPILHQYVQCMQNRSKKNKYFCNACVDFEYKDVFVPICYSNLMSIAVDGMSSIDDPLKHAKNGKQFLADYEENVIFGAQAKTLSRILDEAQAPSVIDFMSLDVEGAELNVLKGIDFNKYSFKFMCIESGKIDEIVCFLDAHKYTMLKQISHHDYLFTRK